MDSTWIGLGSNPGFPWKTHFRSELLAIFLYLVNIMITYIIIIIIYIYIYEAWGSEVVKALRYYSEGLGIDSASKNEYQAFLLG